MELQPKNGDSQAAAEQMLVYAYKDNIRVLVFLGYLHLFFIFWAISRHKVVGHHRLKAYGLHIKYKVGRVHIHV